MMCFHVAYFIYFSFMPYSWNLSDLVYLFSNYKFLVAFFPNIFKLNMYWFFICDLVGYYFICENITSTAFNNLNYIHLRIALTLGSFCWFDRFVWLEVSVCFWLFSTCAFLQFWHFCFQTALARDKSFSFERWLDTILFYHRWCPILQHFVETL